MSNEVPALLRLPEVSRRTGLSRSSIYAAVKRGEFPEPIALGVRAVAWPASLVDQWVQARIAAGRKASVTTAKNAAP